MSHTPHELADDFPGKVDAIHTLKETNSHFAKLMEKYHDINRQVHSAETLVTPMATEAETAMRKERMALKDQIAKILAEAS